MKFKPEHHIVGKVYDLTQENMNAMIAAFEEQKKENARIREALNYIANASWQNHPEISEAIDGQYLDSLFAEKARVALEGE
jgi:hypothetical protein